MKLLKGKSKRTVLFGALTLAIMVILIGLNVLASAMSLDSGAYVDMTPEGLYTVSDAMLREIAFIDELGKTDGDKTVKITFCTDPDYLVNSLTTRPTYLMALSLEREFSNFEVETVNVDNNPTALSMYRTTSLTDIKISDVIISYGDRYRIVGSANFWTTDYFSYNGEYRLATLIKSVTSIEQPKAYFLTDHGETYYDVNNPESENSKKSAHLYDLLRDRGLVAKTLDLSSVDAIPDDCALLIINNPTKDFTVDADRFDEYGYVSDTEKIDRYLAKNQGAVMVAKDYSVSLPIFEDFLHEWGFEFSDSQVRDSQEYVPNEDGTNTDIISVYETEKDSYANAIYGSFASISSAPSTVFSNTGYLTNTYGESGYKSEPGSPDTVLRYASFLKSSENAVAYLKGEDGSYTSSSVVDSNKGSFDLAGVTVREAFDSVKNEYSHSYLFCAASGEFFSNELLGNNSYANFDIVSALVDNISRVDVYASLELGGTSLNSDSYGGKQMVDMTLSETDTNVYSPDASSIVHVNKGITMGAKIAYSVAAAIIPVGLLAAGIVVCIKRRFL